MNEGTVFQPRGSAEIAPGLRLNETYEIVGFVGEGGLSQVYRAFNIRNRHPVAIKFLRADLIGDADTMELFNREATILAELSHDAIVKYLGFSFDPAIRREYLVMEFVEGVSLETRMRERALSASEALTLKTRIAGGLSAAHRRGAVHRDMSPDNVILPGGDIENAKIIDFGIAKALKFSANTVIGTGLAGKFSYMSPEQVFGGEVTEKSDVYSLGLVLAAALRGVPLDMGKTLAELAPKRSTAPELVGVDPTLQPLIARMLRPNPAERPGMDDVANWRPEAGRPAPVKPPASGSRVGGIAALLGAFVIGASLVATGYVFRDDLSNLLRRPAPAPSESDQASGPTGDAASPSPTVVETQRPMESGQESGPIKAESETTVPTPTASVVATPTPTIAETSAPPAPPRATVTPPAVTETVVATSKSDSTPKPVPTPATTAVVALTPLPPPKAPSALMTLDIAHVGRPFRQALPAFESDDLDGLRVSAKSALPEGLELRDAGRGVAVVVGTPSQGGAMAFTIVATDRNNHAATMRAIAIVAERPAAASPSPPPRATPAPVVASPSPPPRPTPAPVVASPSAPPAPPPAPVVASPSPPPAAPPPSVLASPPPSAPAATSAQMALADSLATLLKRYAGAECWLTRAERQGESPSVEAVSGDAARLDQFASDLSRQVGSSPVLNQVAIDRSQCPALALARAEGADGGSGPRLELAARGVGGAVPLAGTVRGLAGRTLTLLVVRDNGRTASLKVTSDSPDSARFSLDITKVDDEDVGRKLAVAAIVSSRPLPSLREVGPNQPRALVSLGAAADLFPKLAPEAVEAGAWTDVEFVTLARP